MAIFHLDVKNISRSQGRSVVSAAAYRAGERLIDERLGMAFDYSNKKGVVFSEIMAPDSAPEWVYDRSALWNQVEAIEKRKDARLAKEVLVALPKELSQEEQIELLRDYCQHEFVSKGMIADVNIHADNPDNPHAHILLTTREITSSGFGLKNRDWNKREFVIETREVWQDKGNVHLHLAGHATRIDCRSFQDRGIDLEPGLHLGMAPHYAKERGEGENFARYIDHMDIVRANGERLIRDPGAVIEKLTQQEAVFDSYEIAKLANQYSADLEQYNAVFAAIKNSKEVIALGKNEYGTEVFSTRKMIELEHRMLDIAYELNVKQGHKVSLEAAHEAQEGKTLSEDQRLAFSHIISSGDLAIVTGLAGTGKSYLMGAAREAFESSGYRVSGVCLSGIAAQELQNGAGIQSTTLDTRLLQWENGHQLLTSKDVLVLDEAGMVGTAKHERLLHYANEAGAKVIIVHDPKQLGAIAAGSPSHTLAKYFGEVSLTEVKRQKDPEMSRATYEFGTGKTREALERYESLGALNLTAVDDSIARHMLIEAWAAERQEGKSQLILAYTNENVRLLNEMARHVRIGAGEIDKGKVFQVAKGERAFSDGDKVYFLRNNKELDVRNGTLGVIEQIKEGRYFEVKVGEGANQRTVTFDIQKYKEFDYGYAATVHKAQGVTVGNTYVLASKEFNSHLAYVAFTRHRDSLQVFASQKEFKTREAFFDSLSRERIKSMAVDYAISRWIEPKNRSELNLSRDDVPQKQLAQERLEIKSLNEHLPERKFSFARAMEGLKGWIQGVVRLGDGRSMLCVERDGETKLVETNQGLEKYEGKHASLKLNGQAKIERAEMGDGKKELRVKKIVSVSEKENRAIEKIVKQSHEKSCGDDFGR